MLKSMCDWMMVFIKLQKKTLKLKSEYTQNSSEKATTGIYKRLHLKKVTLVYLMLQIKLQNVSYPVFIPINIV